MDIVKATAKYERWLGTHLTLIAPDLALKHEQMALGVFPFFRATYYRWCQTWPEICEDAARAPKALSAGDLHVENFGTWRDVEGRLIWGVNDFDEAWPLPYTNDLIRLAASAVLAIECDERFACETILTGYREALEQGGRAITLAEHHEALRAMAVERLHNPSRFWDKLHSLPDARKVPARVRKMMARTMPEPGLRFRIVRRVAGLGSLGRQRFVALADWHGGSIAREAKALAPSASAWAAASSSTRIRYQDLVDTAVRSPDPFLRLRAGWLVRRRAPDCSRIPLVSLPRERDTERLLNAMGWETANIHLGSLKARVLAADLRKRRRGWLERDAEAMRKAVDAEWREWKKQSTPVMEIDESGGAGRARATR